MKGKHFFIENRKEIEIQEFDYQYVRNAFMKEYDPTANRQYCYTVIVSRRYDATGEPIFDVRTLDLNEIFFDNTRLRMLEVMIDEIGWDKNAVKGGFKNLPTPPLQKEYQDYLAGKVIKAAQLPDSPTLIDIPPPPPLERVPVQEDDNRIQSVELMFHGTDTTPVPMVVLDWVDNFAVMNHEISVQMRTMTEKQIKMVASVNTHSQYLQTVMNNVSAVLEDIFPVNPGFMKRIFGNTDFKISAEDLQPSIERLLASVRIDSRRFAGIQQSFDEITNMATEIKETLEQGVLGCKFAVATIEESFEFDIREERLMKMSIVANQTRLSMKDAEMNFNMNMERFNDIQTVLVPVIVMQMQSSVNHKLDDETVNMIRRFTNKG